MALVPVLSCWSTQAEDDAVTQARQTLIETWGAQVIVPWYEQFVNAALALEDAAHTLCTEGAADG